MGDNQKHRSLAQKWAHALPEFQKLIGPKWKATADFSGNYGRTMLLHVYDGDEVIAEFQFGWIRTGWVRGAKDEWLQDGTTIPLRHKVAARQFLASHPA